MQLPSRVLMRPRQTLATLHAAPASSTQFKLTDASAMTAAATEMHFGYIYP